MISSRHDATVFDAAGLSDSQFLDGAPSLGRSKDELMRNFRKLVDEGQALLKSTAALSGEALAQAQAQLRGKIDETKSQARELSTKAKNSGQKAMASTNGYIRENPWPAVGIAAGAGFVIGVLAFRR